MNKIRTSDVSGQMHYLSNWYKQFQSETDTTRKSDGDDGEGKTPSKSNVSPDTVNDKVQRKDTPQHGTETNTTTTPRPTSLNPFPNVSPGTGTVKRTSSGRIVRQRVDLAIYNRHEETSKKEDKNVNDKEKRKDTPQHGTETNTTTTPRPTSLNPFRIPVNLLNFKQTQSTLVTRQAK